MYGLAKHHKTDTPLRPVLSSVNSIYHKIASGMTKWLSVVPETQINLKTSDVVREIKVMRLNPEQKLVSFDIKSLYTNVPATEALKLLLIYCTTMTSILFRGQRLANSFL